jgi:hypothetical protein
MQRIFEDPMLAGLIWRVVLLGFVAIMYLALRSEDSDHEWWGDFATRMKLARDEDEAVSLYRGAFKWGTLVMLLVTLWHGGSMLYRIYPVFSGGAKEVTQPVDPKEGLPERRYGAGVAVKVNAGQPQREGEVVQFDEHGKPVDDGKQDTSVRERAADLTEE